MKKNSRNEELVRRHWRCTTQLQSIRCTWLISPWEYSLNADVCVIKWQEHQSYSEQRVSESTSSYPETPLTAERAQYSWTRAASWKIPRFTGFDIPEGTERAHWSAERLPSAATGCKNRMRDQKPTVHPRQVYPHPTLINEEHACAGGQQTCCSLWYW